MTETVDAESVAAVVVEAVSTTEKADLVEVVTTVGSSAGALSVAITRTRVGQTACLKDGQALEKVTGIPVVEALAVSDMGVAEPEVETEEPEHHKEATVDDTIAIVLASAVVVAGKCYCSL
jgi:hypothetical protein